MKGPPRLVATATIAAALAVACSPSTEPSTRSPGPATASSVPTPSASSTNSISASTVVPTVLSTQPPSEDDASNEATAAYSTDAVAGSRPAAPGELILRRCWFRWFDHFEFELDWNPGTPVDAGTSTAGHSIQVEFGMGRGDVAGRPGTLTLPGPGIHRVIVPTELPISRDEIPYYWDDPPFGECVLVSGDVVSGANVEIAMTSPPAVPDSLQAQFVGLRGDVGLFPLAGLVHALERHRGVPFDRVYIDPDGELANVNLAIDGSCLELRQSYVVNDDWVLVEQRRDCVTADDVAGARIIGVSDDEWEVRVVGTGSAAERVAERLVGFFVAGAAPVSGDPVPTADDWVADWLEERPQFEIAASLDWNGETVLILDNTTARADSRYGEALVVGAQARYAGGSTLGCEEFTVSTVEEDTIRGDEAGFRYVATNDPTLIFSTPLADGTTHIAELAQGNNGDWFALLDLTNIERTRLEASDQIFDIVADTAVTNPDGTAAACTQG